MAVHLKQAALLREWTEEKGWYELQERLLDDGETDYDTYAAVEPHMHPVPGSENLFTYKVALLCWVLVSLELAG